MKRIFQGDITGVNEALEDIYSTFDKIEGYAIHKNPFYDSKKHPKDMKYYNALKKIIKDKLTFQMFIMESYTFKKDRKKYLKKLILDQLILNK